MTDQFTACTSFILREEGGYSDDRRDPGGATNFGITIGDLQAYSGKRTKITPADVQALTQAKAVLIYGAHYWSPLSCALLPPGLDLIVYNFGVNAGVGNVAGQLQRRVGVAVDDFLGPITATAARGVPREALMRGLIADEAAYYQHLAEYPIYGDGWIARLRRCAALAWQMAGLTSAPPLTAVQPAPPPVAPPGAAPDEADLLDAQFNPGA